MSKRGMKVRHNLTGLGYYRKIDPNSKYITFENIEGTTFNTLEEWYNYPYKYDIMIEAIEFKKHLRNISKPKWYSVPINIEMGMFPCIIETPIMKCNSSQISYIKEYLNLFEQSVNKGTENIPIELRQTSLGYKILKELKSTTFSNNIFCHMCLDYRSFIVKENKLVGIKNWEYSGFYPPELEDIMGRYLEYLLVK